MPGLLTPELWQAIHVSYSEENQKAYWKVFLQATKLSCTATLHFELCKLWQPKITLPSCHRGARILRFAGNIPEHFTISENLSTWMRREYPCTVITEQL